MYSRYVYPKTLDIIDFFRNFTVTVVGVGDVCSFAQMDIKKHGHPDWHHESCVGGTQYSQAEDGKVELSLVHFKMTNPTWAPPADAVEFMHDIEQVGGVRSLEGASMLNVTYDSEISGVVPRQRRPNAWSEPEPKDKEQDQIMGESIMYLYDLNRMLRSPTVVESTPLLQE